MMDRRTPNRGTSRASMTACVAILTQMAVANVARDVVRVQKSFDDNVAWYDADYEGTGGHCR